MRVLILAVVVLVVLPAWASEPGQPLDGSDWVFVEPGYFCTEWMGFGCPGVDGDACQAPPMSNFVFDNMGASYRFTMVPDVVPSDCGLLGRVALYRYDGNQETLFAYLDSRCGTGGGVDMASPTVFHIQFDDKGGRLLLWIYDRCVEVMPPHECPYTNGWWVAAIGGFTTTFEIMQTYQPGASALGFRIPYMPEGMNGADSFDTYWGDLATVGDWSQAQGLQCSYPAEIPSVGDYLTVADTLPTPSPGQGYYYVTAATYQGATRYGRKKIGGVITGRDPAVLPGCSE